jgi:dUTP pyrophosphatase
MDLKDFIFNQRVNALEHALEELQAGPKVKFKKLHPDAVLPRYMTAGAAGMDLTLHTDNIVLMPEQHVLIQLGFSMELPPGYEAQVRPRSGMALKHAITVLNAPGTVDEDYRGEMGVLLINHGELHTLHKGERIAQLIIARVARAQLFEVDELTETARGSGGYGHTGTK